MPHKTIPFLGTFLILSCLISTGNAAADKFPWPMFLPAMCTNSGPDCNGVEGGGAYLDNCNICVGGTTGNIPCTQDCTGEWGGTAVIDSCGICNGDGPPCPPECTLACTSTGFTYSCGTSSYTSEQHYCYVGYYQYTESYVAEYTNGYTVSCVADYCGGPLICSDNTGQSCTID